MPVRRPGVWLLNYAVLCALVVSAGAVCAERRQATLGNDDRFVAVAEGVTSPDEKHGIRAAFRMWSAPDLEAACAKTPAPATLAPGRTEVTLKAGKPFALNRLVVVARDRAGQVVQQVPIMVEAADQQPPLLNLRADALADGSLTSSKPGHFRLRVRALCETNPVSVEIPASVTP
jgi:hypothetical protein